jgi:glutamine amidotransferase
MISIVDYGVGNVASLQNMYDYLGVDACIVSRPEELASAEKLILPGVGAFDRAMSTLNERDLYDPLREAAEGGTPLLGVCLGMQLLASASEEGAMPGLGLIEGSVRRLSPDPNTGLKVPNIGWAELDSTPGAPLFRDAGARERFYFVHSYHLACDDRSDIAATIDYGGPVTVAVSRGNIHGVQFHPEKSHRFGMRLLAAFARL